MKKDNMKASNAERVMVSVVLGIIYATIYYFVNNFLLYKISNLNKISWYGALLFGILLALAFEFLNPKFESYLKKKFGN